MRAKEFIVEADWEDVTAREAFLDFARRIKRDCQPFIQANHQALKNNEYLYRGVKAASVDQKFIQGDVRTDRRPRDTSKIWHQILDEFFQSKFGWPYRSAGLFATTDMFTAIDYGKAYAIFPIGEYRLCYSPVISDMTIDLTGSMSINATISPKIAKILSGLQDHELQEVADQYNIPNLNTPDDLREIMLAFNRNQLSSEYDGFPNMLAEYILPKMKFKETPFYSDTIDSEVMVHCQSYYGVAYSRTQAYELLEITKDILS